MHEGCTTTCPRLRGLGGEGRGCACSDRATRRAVSNIARAISSWATSRPEEPALIFFFLLWTAANAAFWNRAPF